MNFISYTFILYKFLLMYEITSYLRNGHTALRFERTLSEKYQSIVLLHTPSLLLCDLWAADGMLFLSETNSKEHVHVHLFLGSVSTFVSL
jgi:hypothetical protein